MSTAVENAEGHVLELRARPPSRWATRDRILLEASRLFATHGFRGASTRQIAEQVGIRQPSLFKHFGSKRAMLAELAVYDMDVPARHAEACGECVPARQSIDSPDTWRGTWSGTGPCRSTCGG